MTPNFEPWVAITIGAALLQCLRTAQQKRLTAYLRTNAVTFVRYLYGAPVAATLLLLLAAVGDAPLPRLSTPFVLDCIVGGIAQIAATSLLILSFKLRNFAVGTTYSKTETVQTALLSTLVLAEPLSAPAWGAIAISLMGVVLLSLQPGRIGLREVVTGWTQTSALVGLASGGLFAVSAISIRAAALSLDHGDFLVRALITLAFMTAIQTALMVAWLAWREREELRKVIVFWKPAALVGLLSVFGSLGWFSAMTLQNAAHVRALGQVELVFTVVVSRYGFRERPTAQELCGIALIAGGVVTLLLAR